MKYLCADSTKRIKINCDLHILICMWLCKFMLIGQSSYLWRLILTRLFVKLFNLNIQQKLRSLQTFLKNKQLITNHHRSHTRLPNWHKLRLTYLFLHITYILIFTFRLRLLWRWWWWLRLGLQKIKKFQILITIDFIQWTFYLYVVEDCLWLDMGLD